MDLYAWQQWAKSSNIFVYIYNHQCREMSSFYLCTCQFCSLFSWKSKSNVWHSPKAALNYSSSQFFLKTKLASWIVKLWRHFCSRIPLKCLPDTTRYHLYCPSFFSTIQTYSNGLYSSWCILWVIPVSEKCSYPFRVSSCPSVIVAITCEVHQEKMWQICECRSWFGKQTGTQFTWELAELPFCLVISQTSWATQGPPLIKTKVILIQLFVFSYGLCSGNTAKWSTEYLVSIIRKVSGSKRNEINIHIHSHYTGCMRRKLKSRGQRLGHIHTIKLPTP